MLLLARSELQLSLKATGSRRGQGMKWPKTDTPGPFCLYWLFHIDFLSGTVDGKVWKERHKMKFFFFFFPPMKAQPWSCYKFWNYINWDQDFSFCFQASDISACLAFYLRYLNMDKPQKGWRFGSNRHMSECSSSLPDPTPTAASVEIWLKTAWT